METPAPEMPVEAQAPPAQEAQQVPAPQDLAAAAAGTPAQDVATAIPGTAPVVSQGASAEQVAEVLQSYRKEFEETYEGLRHRSVGLQDESVRLISETSASIEPVKQDLIDTMTATTEVATPPLAIVNTFGWASVLLFSASVASIFGAYLFAPLVGVFVGKFGAAIVAGFGLPVYGYYMIKKAEVENTADVQTRFSLLSMALVQGLLSGFVLSDTYVSAQPLAFLFPAAVTVAYPFIQNAVGSNRINLLAATVGAAFAVNFVFGFLSGSLTSTYLLLSVLYGAASAGVMQLMFRNVIAPEQRVNMYQLAVLASFVAVKLAVFGICGYSAEEMELAQSVKAH